MIFKCRVSFGVLKYSAGVLEYKMRNSRANFMFDYRAQIISKIVLILVAPHVGRAYRLPCQARCAEFRRSFKRAATKALLGTQFMESGFLIIM